MPIRNREHVPSVRRPLVGQPVAVELRVHHAAEQRIVDAGVVVREEDPEPLAGLQRDGLGLQLLRVAGAHREFAFERHDLRRPHRCADNVPERGFSSGGGDADARWSAVDVVGDVGGLDVPGERPDAPPLRLRERRMIGQTVIGQQRLQRAGAAAESQRIDRQHRDIRRDVVTPIPGRLVFAEQRFAHDHPQGIAGRRAVAGGEHELVAVRVFGAAVVEPEAPVLVTGQVGDDVERAYRPAARRNDLSARSCRATRESCRSGSRRLPFAAGRTARSKPRRLARVAHSFLCVLCALCPWWLIWAHSS